METKSYEFNVSANEAQTVILDWVRATEEFHNRYYQINEVINSVYRNRCERSTMDTARKARMRNLLRLRQYMSDVLMTLLTDMTATKLTRGSEGVPTAPSKPGQLMSHTRLLQDLNREVEQELQQLLPSQTIAQA